MDLRSVIETGSEALAEQVGKLTASLPSDVSALAESTLGKEIASLVKGVTHKGEADNGTAESATATAADAPVATSAPVPAPSAPPAAESVPAVGAGDLSGSDVAQSSSHRGLIVGGAVAAGVAAAGYVIWRRRRAEASDEESPWESERPAAVVPIASALGVDTADDQAGDQAGGPAAQPPSPDDTSEDVDVPGGQEVGIVAGQEPFEAGMAADQLPEANDPDLAAAIDAEAEHFASDFIDHVDDEETDDPELAAEIDAEADHFAADFVNAVEVTDEPLPKDE